MSASEYSKILQFEITSANGEKTVDVSGGFGGYFTFYEDIFSPVMTANTIIMDSGKNSITSKKYNETLFSGLPLNGGEKVKIKIQNQNDQILDLKSMVCYKPSLMNTKDNKQTTGLSMISDDFFKNEKVRVKRKLKENPTHENVRSILKTELNTDKEVQLSPATSKFSYQGNNRKPYTVIMSMAPQTVGDKPGKVAGYIFYQTRRGYNFRSIDELSAQPPIENYYMSNVMQTQYDPKSGNPDKKILAYNQEMVGDYMKKAQTGSFGAIRYNFDPFLQEMDDNATFDFALQADSSSLLGKNEYKLSDEEIEVGSRIFVGLKNSQDPLDASNLNLDFSSYSALASGRYNILFTQVLNITVPSNFDLHAGDVINVDVPKIGCNFEFDNNLSGLYLIKELCHYIDESNSYTSLRLVRDTQGRKTKFA